MLQCYSNNVMKIKEIQIDSEHDYLKGFAPTKEAVLKNKGLRLSVHHFVDITLLQCSHFTITFAPSTLVYYL